MVTLTGKITDATGRTPESISSITVKAPSARIGGGSDIIVTSPAEVTFDKTTGDITLSGLHVGLSWLYIEGDGWSDSIPLAVAEGFQLILEAVANASGIPGIADYVSMIRNSGEHAILLAQAALDGEFGAIVRAAQNAATTAAREATSADARATSAENKVDSYTPRVDALEAMAGLSPESPVDGQTANLLTQPDTLTRAALDASRVDMSVGASQSTAPLGPELVTEEGWTLGAGWSGDLTNGFTHAAGDTSVLEYDSEDFGTGLFLVNFTLSPTIPPLQNLEVTLGDSDAPYLYTGGANVGTALLVSTAGPLKFTPVRTPWSGTITDISVREVVGDVPASMIWQDDQGQDAVKVRVGQAGQDNIFVGDHAGQKNVTGYANVVLGKSSMWENVSGYWNVAVGWSAMRNNVSGSRNVAVGQRALVNNTTGYRNVVVGQSAMVTSTTGHSNIAIGADSMLQNRTGSSNVAIGLATLASGREAEQNVAIGAYAMNTGAANRSVGIGWYALYAAASDGNVAVGSQASRYSKGESNSALGTSAGINNVNGNDNTVIGFEAGRGRSISNASYSRVTAIGKNAGRRLGTGHDENTLIGYSALGYADGGVDNTVIGTSAGLSAVGEVLNRNVLIGKFAGMRLETGGDENTLIGTQAGITLTTGRNNVLIGHNIQASSPTASNEINIGNVIKGSNVPGFFEVSIEGKLRVANLPNQDPNSLNQVWNDNGTLKVSAG